MLLRPASTRARWRPSCATCARWASTPSASRASSRPTSSTTSPTATGILVMPGWCCCDQWEQWDKWDAEDHRVAPASLRDQILRLRNHPSVLAWLNGSDFPPPADVEQAYLDVLEELRVAEARRLERDRRARAGERPQRREDARPLRLRAAVVLADRQEERRRLRLRHRDRPGRRGAAHREPEADAARRSTSGRSTSSGTSTPAATSSRTSSLFTAALEARYGKATGVEDYARKAQALAYEGQRAMFEALRPQQVHARPASSSGCSTTPGRR